MASVVIRSVLVAFFLLVPGVAALAQAPEPASQPNLLKPEELDQLVAPIALYPDPLLAQVLIASAYPLDIVQAERWLQSHKNLTGDALKAALARKYGSDGINPWAPPQGCLEMMVRNLNGREKFAMWLLISSPM